MNRSEYLAEVMRSLDFLTESARREVMSDMEELYTGLSERGMGDQQIQERIGSPHDVAAEYRLADELDHIEQSPGAKSGMRIAYASLTGRLARGVAFQLFGLVWLVLSICALALIICTIAGIAVTIAAIAGYEPLLMTLAVPGIPAIVGVLIGISATAATIALLLGNRLLMRVLSRWMRHRLRRRHTDAVGGQASNQVQQRVRRRWINTGRAVWLFVIAAVALSIAGAALTPVLDAPVYSLVVDQRQPLSIEAATAIEVHADEVDVRVAIGEQAEVHLTAHLRRTFAQHVGLQVDTDDAEVVVEATYREGLSWGINPRPILLVILPQDHLTKLSVLSDGGRVDLGGLPGELRDAILVEAK